MKALKVLSIFALFFVTEITAQTIAKTVNEAKTIAINGNKKIVVEFSTDWCPYCKKFKNKTLLDETVKAKLKNFVFVSINPEKFSDGFVKMNDEKSYPKLILLDKNGNILNKNIGYMDTKEFLEFLN